MKGYHFYDLPIHTPPFIHSSSHPFICLLIGGSVILTSRFDQALLYASELHRRQMRKGTDVPYLAHLLGVASIALEACADEDEAIAALLHDAAEDQGGRKTLEEIRARFGERVAHLVEVCTDTFEEPRPAWMERKRGYLARLADEPAGDLLVACADKLYNARAILQNYREIGEQVWDRFNAGREDILWYYRSLPGIFVRHTEPRVQSVAQELARTVAALERLAAGEDDACC
jgi:(p)ppGpp synthase/HD superfamily hydrolase